MHFYGWAICKGQFGCRRCRLLGWPNLWTTHSRNPTFLLLALVEMTQGNAGGVVGYFIVRCAKRSFSFSIDFLNTFSQYIPVNWRVGRPPCSLRYSRKLLSALPTGAPGRKWKIEIGKREDKRTPAARSVEQETRTLKTVRCGTRLRPQLESQGNIGGKGS